MNNENLGAKLHDTMDAQVWAKEFCRLNNASDEGMMLAWFANAIMVGYDHAKREAPTPVTAIDWPHAPHLENAASAPAPVTAEPADLSASSLLKRWQRANAAATDTMPAPFQFAKLLLANAPAPADRDAILEDAALQCDAEKVHVQKWHPSSDGDEAYNAGCDDCAQAIRALKSMERAADAAETRDAKGGEHE